VPAPRKRLQHALLSVSCCIAFMDVAIARWHAGNAALLFNFAAVSTCSINPNCLEIRPGAGTGDPRVCGPT